MQVATEHSKAVGQGAGVGVEKRLLFDRVALHAANIAPGNIEFPALVEAHFADAGLPFGNGAAMTTGKAADAVAFDGFVQPALADALVENFAERRQQDL
jgi:hypothetical protein